MRLPEQVGGKASVQVDDSRLLIAVVRMRLNLDVCLGQRGCRMTSEQLCNIQVGEFVPASSGFPGSSCAFKSTSIGDKTSGGGGESVRVGSHCVLRCQRTCPARSRISRVPHREEF